MTHNLNFWSVIYSQYVNCTKSKVVISTDIIDIEKYFLYDVMTLHWPLKNLEKFISQKWKSYVGGHSSDYRYFFLKIIFFSFLDFSQDGIFNCCLAVVQPSDVIRINDFKFQAFQLNFFNSVQNTKLASTTPLNNRLLLI